MIFVGWAGPAARHGIGNPAGRYDERGGEVIMAENQDVTMILASIHRVNRGVSGRVNAKGAL